MLNDQTEITNKYLRRILKMIKSILFSIFTISLLISSGFSQASISTAVTTKVAVSEIKDGISDVLAEVEGTSDYVSARMLITALEAIDAWEVANSALLDKTFGGIDKANQDILNNFDALLKRADRAASDNINNIEAITTQINLANENFFLNSKRSYILKQTPLIVPPTNQELLTLRLNGINLDTSEAKLTFKGITYQARILGPTQLEFDLPVAQLEKTNKLKSNLLTINHKTRDGSNFFFFPKYKDVVRTLNLVTLPEALGTYTLNIQKNEASTTRKQCTQDGGMFSGKNTTKSKIIRPCDNDQGWAWDTSNRGDFSVVSTGRGEAGRCQGISWNNSSKDGIKINARLDERRRINGLNISYDGGYKHCGLRGPITKPITNSVSEIRNGNLNWLNDINEIIPDNAISFSLTVKTFDGKIKVHTGSGTDKFLEINNSVNNLIISPVTPEDIL
ncbi:MAG: hypothetical protein ACI92O_000741 [Colwellia sp.]